MCCFCLDPQPESTFAAFCTTYHLLGLPGGTLGLRHCSHLPRRIPRDAEQRRAAQSFRDCVTGSGTIGFSRGHAILWRCRPAKVELASTRFAAKSTDVFDRSQSNLGWTWPNLGATSADFGTLWSTWGQFLPVLDNVGRISPISPTLGSISSHFGRIWRTFGRTRPNLVRLGLDLGDFGPVSAVGFAANTLEVELGQPLPSIA